MGIVLHIGAPKTGTTYLQEWLRLNARRLEKHGIKPISALSSHRLGVEGLVDPKMQQRGDVQKILDIDFQEALDELAATLKHYPATIISSEYFFESSPHKVAQFLSALDAPVTQIICYLRRQDIICASGYAEEVRSLQRHHLVNSARYIPSLDWDLLHRGWRRAFPDTRLNFRNFDKARSVESLADSFTNILGVNHIQAKRVDAVINPSLSSELVELARLINEKGRPVSAPALTALQEAISSPPFSFSQDVTSQFERAYLDSNRHLATTIPGEFDDFALPGWVARGKDLTGALSRERLIEIFADCFQFVGEKHERLAVMETKQQSLRYLVHELVRATVHRMRSILTALRR